MVSTEEVTATPKFSREADKDTEDIIAAEGITTTPMHTKELSKDAADIARSEEITATPMHTREISTNKKDSVNTPKMGSTPMAIREVKEKVSNLKISKQAESSQVDLVTSAVNTWLNYRGEKEALSDPSLRNTVSSKTPMKENLAVMDESRFEEDYQKNYDEYTEVENLKYLCKTFEEAQNSLSNHSKNSKAILKRFPDPSVLFWYMEHFIRLIFLQGKPSPQVDRSIKFIVKISICISNGRQFSDVLVDKLLKYCMKYWNCKNKHTRRQICNLIGSMLNGLDEDWEMDDDVWSALQHLLLIRLRDKVPQIRKSAATALKRLQNPELQMECPVQKGLCELMDHDKSKEVRLEALKTIDINGDSLLAIYRRLRDQDESVRAFTYQRLCKVACNALSIKDRVNAINTGLKDRSSKVKSMCSNLLSKSWFKNSKNDILQFLNLLDPEQYESECELIVKHLLENGDEMLGAQPPYPLEELNVETVLYWRIVVDYLQEKDDREGLNHVLPTIANYTGLLRSVKQREFIAWQLLKMAKHLEYFDEFGRATLLEELLSMLKDKSLSSELMPFIMKVLRKCIENEDEFIRQIIENVINEIRDPIDERESDEVISKRKYLVDKLQAAYTMRDVARKEQTEMIEQENLSKAEKAEKSILKYSDHIQILEGELQKLQKDDLGTWKRVLIIIADLLEYTKQPITHPFLQPLIETTLRPAIGHCDPEIREPGLLAFGLYCLMDKDTAKSWMPLFAQVLQHDQLALKYLALKIVFDLFTVFNFKEPKQEKVDPQDKSEGNKDESHERYAQPVNLLLEILCSFLAHNDQDLLACTVEGFCKLLLLNRLPMNHQEVLCHLILLYFNNHTEENEQIRQCLALFFPYFVSGKKDDRNRKLVLKCFMPCLREVAYASASSPFSSANISMLAEFILSLLTVNPQTSLDLTEITVASAVHYGSHESVVFDVLFEIEASTEDEVALPFCRVLSVLTIDAAQQENVKKWKELLRGIMERVKKKNCLLHLRRFKDKLDANDSNPDEELPESVLQAIETRKIIAVETVRSIYDTYTEAMDTVEESQPTKRPRKRKHKKNRGSQGSEDAPRQRKRKRLVSDESDEHEPLSSGNAEIPDLEVDEKSLRETEHPSTSALSDIVIANDQSSSSSSTEPAKARRKRKSSSSNSEYYKLKKIEQLSYSSSPEPGTTVKTDNDTPMFKRFPVRQTKLSKAKRSVIRDEKYESPPRPKPSGVEPEEDMSEETEILLKPKTLVVKQEENESEEDEIDKFIAASATRGITDPGLEALLSDSGESS